MANDWEEDWGADDTGFAAPAQTCTMKQYDDDACDFVNVPTKDIGAVIGRGGSTIRELEREFGVRVRVDRQSGDVSINGGDNGASRQACIQKINSLVSGGRTGPFQSNSREFIQPRTNDFGQQSGGESCTIAIATQDIGLIIGRGGSKIQEIERNSGARVKLHRDALQVVVSGSKESRCAAIDLIKAACERQERRQAPVGEYGFQSQPQPAFQNSRQQYQQPQVAQSSNSKNALVESGWDDDEDWGAGAITTTSTNHAGYQASSTCNYSSAGYTQQPHESRGRENYQQRSYNFTRPSRDYGSRSSNFGGSRGGHQRQQQSQSSWSGWGNDDDNNGSRSEGQTVSVSDAPIDWEATIRQSEEISLQRWAHLPPVIKDFYREDPEVAAMLEDEVVEFRKSSNNIMVSNADSSSEEAIPNPVLTFEQAFSSYPEILDEIRRNKFVTPSPVQSQAWPVLLSGRDTVAIAQTGTGKTLAFLLPAFVHIEGQITPRDQRKGPSVICLCPTRELAQQIYAEVLKYNYHNIKAVCIYGGKGRKDQINSCQQGVEIVIATPGRLNDLIMNGFITLEDVTYLVLDEADRMLDMGFEPDIRKVLLDVRPDRQSVMTSATWPYGVRKMASRYLQNPVQIYVGSLDLNAVHTVCQEIRFVAEEEKRRLLFDFICNELSATDKILVFCGRKSTCSDVASDLSRNDIPCESIHGDREQQDREDALADFKSSEIRILIATDVASRGLDVIDVTHVLNYDFPKDMEEYVHRVGRTGRAGRSGIAISYMTRQDWNKAAELIKILQDADQEVPSELTDMAERFRKHQERMEQEREFCDSFLDGSSRPRRGRGGGGGFGGGRRYR